MKEYRRSLLLLISFLILFEGLVIYIGFNRPRWGDEGHFVEAIRKFGNEISLNTITHYEEMSTPLSFLLYAIWGRLFGFELQTLRILSVIIAFLTYISFHYLIYSLFNDSKIALAATAFIILHPYMVGFSIFVFTDMLPILFSIICLIAIKKNYPIIFTFSAMAGLLSRQYFIFFTVATGLYYLFHYINKKDSHPAKMLLSVSISVVPLILLIFLWGGLSPDNNVKKLYLTEGIIFHPTFLTLYIIQFFAYLFPVVLIRWKYFFTNVKILITSFIVSFIYWLFPVTPCKPAIAMDIPTVGFFHRLVRFTLGEQFEYIVFYIFFILGLSVVITIIQDCYKRMKDKKLDLVLLLDFSLLSFLIIMPFSYLSWEKYFMPVVPLAAIQMLLVWQEERPVIKKINIPASPVLKM